MIRDDRPFMAFKMCIRDRVGTFVEVAFKTAGEKAEFVPADVRLVFLRDENILFVQD